jgi:hypothetical protein
MFMPSKYPLLIALVCSFILTTVEVLNTASQFSTEGIPYGPIALVFFSVTVFFYAPFVAIELVVRAIKKLF